MHAAGVVSDHAAQGASVVACGVRTKRQLVFFRGVSQTIEDHARLDPRYPALRIDLEDGGHVLREIEHHGDVAALSGERSSAAPAEDGRAIFASQRDGRDDIVDIAGKNHSDRNLAIVGSVGGVERAASVVEANVTAHVTAEGGGKSTCIHYGRFGGTREVGEVTWHLAGDASLRSCCRSACQSQLQR